MCDSLSNIHVHTLNLFLLLLISLASTYCNTAECSYSNNYFLFKKIKLQLIKQIQYPFNYVQLISSMQSLDHIHEWSIC